jgi:hypothetical protein
MGALSWERKSERVVRESGKHIRKEGDVRNQAIYASASSMLYPSRVKLMIGKLKAEGNPRLYCSDRRIPRFHKGNMYHHIVLKGLPGLIYPPNQPFFKPSQAPLALSVLMLQKKVDQGNVDMAMDPLTILGEDIR